MKNFLQNTLLLIACCLVAGNSIYAEENNNTRRTMENYSFEKVSKQKPSTQKRSYTNTAAVQLALIDNNKSYVLITAGVYAFTLLIITFLMKITTHRATDLVTIIGLVSVVFGTILLVLVVDTTETLTAPMGILGVIAGYLFGTTQRKTFQGSDE